MVSLALKATDSLFGAEAFIAEMFSIPTEGFGPTVDSMTSRTRK